MHLRKIRRAISVFLLAAVLMVGVAPISFASISAKVSSSSARAYQKASSKSTSVQVPKNLKVSITAVSGDWAKVSCKGKSAYMPMKDLKPTSKAKAYAASATAVYNSSGKKKGTLAKGTGVYVLGTVNGCYCVMNGSGAVGYVKSGTLTDKKPAVTNAKKQTLHLSKVDRALATGASLLGRKYSLHDNPPSSFNCSSFVQYCMGKAGISMKGTAAAQAADGRYEKITRVSSLKKGDVLCFDTSGDGKVDHSAIYMGGNKFIEASHNAGRVQTNTLTNWYKSHFVCARRPA